MPPKPPHRTYAFDAPAPPRRPSSDDGLDLDGRDLDGRDLDGRDLDGRDLDGRDLDGRDLDHTAAVEKLVHLFYQRVGEDAVLGPIFNDVARVDWDKHLPRMVRFWQSVLLTTGSYHGDPMATHQALAQRTPLGERELAHWLALFRETVDMHFEGPQAERAKQSAARIAAAIGRKLSASQPLATLSAHGGRHEPDQ